MSTQNITASGPREGEGEKKAPSGRPVPRAPGRRRRTTTQLPLRTSFKTFSSMSTILVGEPKNKHRPETEYIVHKELLTRASPFFAAALDGSFAEGLDQTVRLPEDKPEIFEWFLQWLYTGTLQLPVPHCTDQSRHNAQSTPTTSTPAAAAATQPQAPDVVADIADNDRRSDGDLRNAQGNVKYFLLLELYGLSDRLLTTPLSNHILSMIARLSEATNSVPTASDTWLLYDKIYSPSPLHTLVLDLFAYKKTDRLVETHKDEWHPRFLRALCVRLMRTGPEALNRHALASWTPAALQATKGCAICCELLQPGVGGEKCADCNKAYCPACVRKGVAKVPVPFDNTGCKPWAGRGMCARYHDHSDGKASG